MHHPLPSILTIYNNGSYLSCAQTICVQPTLLSILPAMLPRLFFARLTLNNIPINSMVIVNSQSLYDTWQMEQARRL
jgi:hypothetical protein